MSRAVQGGRYRCLRSISIFSYSQAVHRYGHYIDKDVARRATMTVLADPVKIFPNWWPVRPPHSPQPSSAVTVLPSSGGAPTTRSRLRLVRVTAVEVIHHFLGVL
jgi:hypothetical protein